VAVPNWYDTRIESYQIPMHPPVAESTSNTQECHAQQHLLVVIAHRRVCFRQHFSPGLVRVRVKVRFIHVAKFDVLDAIKFDVIALWGGHQSPSASYLQPVIVPGSEVLHRLVKKNQKPLRPFSRPGSRVHSRKAHAFNTTALLHLLRIRMNSIVSCSIVRLVRASGSFNREASGKALSGLVRRRRACFLRSDFVDKSAFGQFYTKCVYSHFV
jgi:hypothetical protein